MKKKNKKLLVQVGLIIFPVFLIMVFTVSFIMYQSTVEAFLKAKDDHMTYLLNQSYSHSIFIDNDELAWLFSKWEEDPLKIREPITDHEMNAMASYYGEYERVDYFTTKWFDTKPKPVRDFIIKDRYRTISNMLSFESEDNNYERLFIIDLNEDHLGMVIAESSWAGTERQIGDYYDFDLKDHSAVKKMFETRSNETVFETAVDFPGKGSYYIGYKPIVYNDKVIGAMGIVYNWNEFRQTMHKTMNKTVMLSIGAMLLAMVILFVLLYRRAVSPVRKIQKSVRDYIETKDSEKVISRMSSIKLRNEFGLLSDNISELANEIDHFTEENVKLAGERERVAAELDMAKEIQAGQLPSDFPAFPDRTEFDIYATMTPAKEVGGDFYDFFFIDDDHLAMVIADVSGKGVPAALFMMMSKILINNYAMMGLSPHEVLERTNDTICKNNKQKMFVTVWFGILEISTGKITASNAGHEYPIIRQPGGKFELIKDKHGFVIGGIYGKKYKDYELTLQKGGTLFVYTDGVPEAADSEEKMFGTAGLVEAINRTPDAMPEQLLKNVHESVNEFVGDAPQFDDLTMLGITLL